MKNKELELKSVLFVEQLPRGELAKRLREALKKDGAYLRFQGKSCRKDR